MIAASLDHISRWRLKAATARFSSAGLVSQFGFMRGGSVMLGLEIETVPRLRVVMRAVAMVA